MKERRRKKNPTWHQPNQYGFGRPTDTRMQGLGSMGTSHPHLLAIHPVETVSWVVCMHIPGLHDDRSDKRSERHPSIPSMTMQSGDQSSWWCTCVRVSCSLSHGFVPPYRLLGSLCPFSQTGRQIKTGPELVSVKIVFWLLLCPRLSSYVNWDKFMWHVCNTQGVLTLWADPGGPLAISPLILCSIFFRFFYFSFLLSIYLPSISLSLHLIYNSWLLNCLWLNLLFPICHSLQLNTPINTT